jgi:hypothetical protein
MRAYLEIHEQRGGTRDTARFPFLVEMDRGEVRPSVHEFCIECNDERFDADWAKIVAQDLSPPEQPRYTLFVKVIRGVQKPYGLRVATENDFFGTEAITTEVTVASRPGLGGTA